MDSNSNAGNFCEKYKLYYHMGYCQPTASRFVEGTMRLKPFCQARRRARWNFAQLAHAKIMGERGSLTNSNLGLMRLDSLENDSAYFQCDFFDRFSVICFMVVICFLPPGRFSSVGHCRKIFPVQDSHPHISFRNPDAASRGLFHGAGRAYHHFLEFSSKACVL